MKNIIILFIIIITSVYFFGCLKQPLQLSDNTQEKSIVFKPNLSFKQGRESNSGSYKNSIGMEFAPILPGIFIMGSPSDEKGRDKDETQHQVTFTKSFYMQTTEVTQGQWKVIMGNNPSSFKNCGDDCPVECISWDDIQKFIKKMNERGEGTYQLPTEAEWEYAARAGSDSAFANGGISAIECENDRNLNEIGWYCGNANRKTHLVAQKEPNAWGLYDMHGNVWEWCHDRCYYYNRGIITETYKNGITDPVNKSGSDRILRGGGWNDDARVCRSANRLSYAPDNRYRDSGFRLVMLRVGGKSQK